MGCIMHRSSFSSISGSYAVTLYRKIKQRSELAAIDMIRSVRMSKAASLIMENRYSIQEIAEMVGYSDTRTLRKHFTEQFGVSPSKYMEKD